MRSFVAPPDVARSAWRSGNLSELSREGPIMIRATSIHPRPSLAMFDPAAWVPSFPLASALWRELCRGFFDPYRPELHYMRGPGPKWRARYGAAAANRGAALVKAL